MDLGSTAEVKDGVARRDSLRQRIRAAKHDDELLRPANEHGVRHAVHLGALDAHVGRAAEDFAQRAIQQGQLGSKNINPGVVPHQAGKGRQAAENVIRRSLNCIQKFLRARRADLHRHVLNHRHVCPGEDDVCIANLKQWRSIQAHSGNGEGGGQRDVVGGRVTHQCQRGHTADGCLQLRCRD